MPFADLLPALPPAIPPATLALLAAFAFAAGLVDAVVGGGGLIQVPAALVLLRGVPVLTILGTGKTASLVGTSAAAVRYARRVALPWRALLPAGLVAAGCSWVGARAVSLLNPMLLKPLLLGLLVALWGYTMAKPDLGAHHRPRFPPDRERWAVLAVAVALGFYDGFFGPGTGSLLVFALVGWLGYDFLRASASAKVIHVCTNLGGWFYFGFHHQVLWLAAVPMAAANLAGSLVGTRLALRGGTRVIRVFFLVIVAVLIGRLTGEVAGWW